MAEVALEKIRELKQKRTTGSKPTAAIGALLDMRPIQNSLRLRNLKKQTKMPLGQR